MSTWTISSLNGAQPAGYLAALGLIHAIPSAVLRFEDTTPVITADLELDTTVETISEQIEAATLPDQFPLPDVKELNSTTPSWPALAEFARQSWQDPRVDAVLRTFDIGSAKERRGRKNDPQVSAASLILISGHSYVRNSLKDLWPPPSRKKDAPAAREQQRARLRSSVRSLMTGGRPTTQIGRLAMRLTTSEPTPRVRLGVETATIRPAVEALAYMGVTCLLPRQLGIPDEHASTPYDEEDPDNTEEDATESSPQDAPTTQRGARRETPGLTWALNPVDLTALAMVAVHEEGVAPEHWQRFTTVRQIIPGGATASRFTRTRLLEES